MIHCVLGTRAQLIKMAPLIKAMEERQWEFTLLHTGQHRETMEDLRNDFGLKSHFQYIYSGPESATANYAMVWLSRVIFTIVVHAPKYVKRSQSRKDIVLVHGDTFSTVLGALLAKRCGMKVGHVESGLRSFNWLNPFPEELNRLITFRLADVAFCPGKWAVDNLHAYMDVEKVDIHQNTLLDSLRMAVDGTITNHQLKEDYCVCSVHRFENVYSLKRLNKIIDMILFAARDYLVVFVLHPVTRKRLQDTGLITRLSQTQRILLMDRLPYSEFIRLMAMATFMITDGGSNQEELYYLGKPTYLVRGVSERQEGLGKNAVIGGYEIEQFSSFLTNINNYQAKPYNTSVSPTKIIMDRLEEFSSA
jgi:UDP-N-acetylglucosamine 2-epimerase (non-hydrolysing)